MEESKKIIPLIFSIIFLVLFLASIVMGIFTYYSLYEIEPLSVMHWVLITILCFVGMLIFNYRRVRKEKVKIIYEESSEKAEIDTLKNEIDDLREDFEQFKHDYRLALKGHLKISILFWIHFYKKEKMRSMEETKKEVFKDLEKEFAHISWMTQMLEDIKKEISKYR